MKEVKSGSISLMHLDGRRLLRVELGETSLAIHPVAAVKIASGLLSAAMEVMEEDAEETLEKMAEGGAQ